MKYLIVIYIVSVLIITTSFSNVKVNNIKLGKTDYFVTLTPIVNTLVAGLIIKIAIDRIILIKTINDLDEKYER